MSVRCLYFNTPSGCKRGSECRYAHDLFAPLPTPKLCRGFELLGWCRAGVSCRFSHTRSVVRCKFFSALDGCANGDGCPYTHPPHSSTSHQPAFTTTMTRPFLPKATTNTSKKIPCHFFTKGTCIKNTLCQYSHAGTPTPPPQTEIDIYYRMYSGAFIQFGDNGAVQAVVLKSEYSAVRIEGVAASNPVGEIFGLAQKYGFDLEDGDVRVFRGANEPHATVRCRNVNFATEATSNTWTWPSSGEQVRATAIPVPTLPGQGHHAARAVECKKLAASWAVPRANDDTDQEAAEVIKTMVRSLCTATSPVESFEVEADSSNNAENYHATIRFASSANALRVTDLDGTLLPCGTRLSVDPIYGAKFTPSVSVYTATEDRIKALAKPWNDQDYAYFNAYPPTDPLKYFCMFKIEAFSIDNLLRASDQLQTILDGVLVTEKDNPAIPLWNRRLCNKDPLTALVTQTAKRHNVVILSNRFRGELRVFGPDNRCAMAIADLRSVLNPASTGACAVHLSPAEFAWACRGGARAVSDALSKNSITFDIVSATKRFIVRGTLADRDKIRQMINDGVNPGPTITTDCVVCFSLANRPVTTPCGHIYCADCLQHSCTSAPTTDDGVRIGCCGDDFKCPAALPLAFVQEHIDTAAFEGILERSFKAYVQRNTTKLRYCPTARCDNVSRLAPTDPPATHICGGCLSQSCASCGNDAHPDLSCTEWLIARTDPDDDTRQLWSELGIQKCPRCGVGIEKISGCNHIECDACGVHICWVCLHTSDESDPIYEHMAEEHDGHIYHDLGGWGNGDGWHDQAEWVEPNEEEVDEPDREVRGDEVEAGPPVRQ